MNDDDEWITYELSDGLINVTIRDRVHINRFKKRAAIEAARFFGQGADIDEWRQRVRDLGIVSDVKSMNTIQDMAESALEVAPGAASILAAGSKEAEAGALAAFAYWDGEMRDLQAHRAAGVLPEEFLAMADREVVRIAVLMGRLMESWRWRIEGHQLNAVMHVERRRTSSDGGRQRATTIRNQREPLFREIQRRLDNGGQIGTICRSMVRQERYRGKPKSLERAFGRWKDGRRS